MSISGSTVSRPLWLRVFYAVPVIGWMARDVMEGDRANLYFLLVTLVSLWGISTLTWGIPGFYIPALASVPVVFVVLLLITRG